MNELYAETSVKKKATASDMAVKVVAILAVVLLFAASIFLGGMFGNILTFVAVAAVVALIWYWPRFKVEWEYVFCDGQFDIDAILGGEKRKQVLRLEVENADLVAPINSSRMDGYRHLQVKDYSSMKPDAKLYAVVTKLKAEKVVLYIEPSEKMLDMMKIKAPNIVEK